MPSLTIRRTLSRRIDYRELSPSLEPRPPSVSRSLRTFSFVCKASIEPDNSIPLMDAVEEKRSSTRPHTTAKKTQQGIWGNEAVADIVKGGVYWWPVKGTASWRCLARLYSSITFSQ